jgi:O-antigen/teichoic acid export membrane protein
LLQALRKGTWDWLLAGTIRRRTSAIGLSDETLTQKALLNTVAAGLDYGTRILIGLVINPLLVGGLGAYSYGALQILDRLAGYASAADGRPSQALKWTIARQEASAEADEKRRTIGSAVAVWLLFLPVLATFAACVAWMAPTWLSAPPELRDTVRMTAALLAANLILANLIDLPRSVLQGGNVGYKRMGLSAGVLWAGAALTAVALYLKGGLVGVAAAQLATTVITGGLFFAVVKKYVAWFGVARPSRADVRRLGTLSAWFLAWRLIKQLMMASDVVVLGMLHSVEIVTAYSLTKAIPDTLIGLIAVVVGAILPGLGRVIGSGDLRKAAGVRSEIMALTWLTATSVGATVILWNHAFLRLWVGERYDAGATATLLLILMVTQLVLIRNDAQIIDLTLDVRHKVLTGALSAVVSLTLAGLLVRVLDLGVTGLCLGFLAGRSILSLDYPWIAGRFLGQSLASQLRSVVRPLLATVPFFVLAWKTSHVFTAGTWIGLTCGMGATMLLAAPTAFYLGLSADARHQLLRRARRIVRPALASAPGSLSR